MEWKLSNVKQYIVDVYLNCAYTAPIYDFTSNREIVLH